jgi:hypothetical protein
VIGQRAQGRVLHALRLVGSLEHGDGLLCLLGRLFAHIREDILFLLIALGQRERDLLGARRYLGPHGHRRPVGEHDRIELQEDVVQRSEVTGEHRQGAPLLRHAGPLFDVASHPSAGGNDDAIVGVDGIDNHRLDGLSNPLDNHSAVNGHPQRRALVHDQLERRA